MTEATPTVQDEFSFKAETKQLLQILIHSLYKDREVFLRELLSNASDALNRIRFAMLTEQNVLDADAELSIRINVDKDARTITIQDTGIGMTTEQIALACQPFGQISTAYARRTGGVGLGLTLVAALTELHGGGFHLQSAPGTGTTAVVMLPSHLVFRNAGDDHSVKETA